MSNETDSIFASSEEDAAAIAARMIVSYETKTGRTLYPADPYRLFLLWEADIIAQLYVLNNKSAERNLLKYAKGSDLDELADMFHDVKRLPETAARTTLRFTLSEPRQDVIIVPAGTRASAGDMVFETTLESGIKALELYADITAKCTVTGRAGNGLMPGQIKDKVDIFPFLGSVLNMTLSEGGADTESDEDFYRRINASFESYSTAGPLGAYEYFARSASSLIRDAKAYSDSPGIVEVRILMEDGALPGTEMINNVYDHLSAAKVRPLTDQVIVSGPDMVPFEVDFTYYMSSGYAGSVSEVDQAVKSAAADYISWQVDAMGRDVNPSELIWRLKETGIKRVEIRQPQFIAIDRKEAAYLDNASVILNGGLEDE